MINKKLRTNLRAFSLVELMVVMVLSTLVVTLSFLVYDAVASSFFTYKEDQWLLQELHDLNTNLVLEINECDRMFTTEGGVGLHFEGRELNYQFYPDYVIRKQDGWSDTISIQVTEYVPMWKQNSLNTKDQLADGLYVDVRFNNEDFTLVFSKSYGADQLMAKFDHNGD